MAGAVLQMFSHGVIAGLLFAVVGRMVYDRTHTRDLDELGPMRLGKTLPFAATVFVLAGMASMGLPGFSGFVAELQVLMGAWQAFWPLVPCAGLGIVVGIAYTWRAMQKAFFADAGEGRAIAAHALPPITLPEQAGAAILLAASIAAGLFPQVLLKLIIPALNSPLFEGLRRGSWQ
jgi:NADH-quinone oxidoreductase subunit M